MKRNHLLSPDRLGAADFKNSFGKTMKITRSELFGNYNFSFQLCGTEPWLPCKALKISKFSVARLSISQAHISQSIINCLV